MFNRRLFPNVTRDSEKMKQNPRSRIIFRGWTFRLNQNSANFRIHPSAYWLDISELEEGQIFADPMR